MVIKTYSFPQNFIARQSVKSAKFSLHSKQHWPSKEVLDSVVVWRQLRGPVDMFLEFKSVEDLFLDAQELPSNTHRNCVPLVSLTWTVVSLDGLKKGESLFWSLVVWSQGGFS